MTTTEQRAPVLFSVERELESWADAVARLPAQVRKAIDAGDGELAARLLVSGGERKEDWLTNVVFHTRHKALKGRDIRPGETELARKWLEIRRDVVRPMLRAAVPVSPAPPVLASQTFPLSPVPTRSVAYWRQEALRIAGINPTEWQPRKGLKHNREIVPKVYAYYMVLFNRNTNLLWAGMAKLAGAAVYGGLLQAQNMINSFNVVGLVMGDVVSPIAVDRLTRLQVQLMEGQRAIFNDLAWQHQAFVVGGLAEMTAHAAAGVDVNAWRDIASGDPVRVRKGNKALLLREQRETVAPYYKEIRALWDFDWIPKQMSERALSPIPDGSPFQKVVPGGDITVFTDRWKWIENDMLPKYEQLTETRRKKLVDHPLIELANRRWP